MSFAWTCRGLTNNLTQSNFAFNSNQIVFWKMQSIQRNDLRTKIWNSVLLNTKLCPMLNLYGTFTLIIVVSLNVIDSSKPEFLWRKFAESVSCKTFRERHCNFTMVCRLKYKPSHSWAMYRSMRYLIALPTLALFQFFKRNVSVEFFQWKAFTCNVFRHVFQWHIFVISTGYII